jgi:adenylate cyclase
LFVEEIVRSLVSKGVLVRQDDRWACREACAAVNVPPTLHGLLLSRIDRLPAEARRLLQEAAVLGMTFDQALLLGIATNRGAADATLDHLVESDLVQQVGRDHQGSRYRFTHALVHEVVYQNLLLTRRTELHERAARALERTTGPRPERLSDLEALGHHWSLASDKSRGARYLVAAGDWARGVYANDDAIRHYERALRTLADCQACDAQVAFRVGDNSGAIAWAERALVEAAGVEETVTDPERAREAAATQAHAYNTLGVALARTGRLDEAVDQIERSIALAEMHDLLQAACRGYTNLGVLYSSVDPRRSIETCLRGLETAKKVGDLGFQSRLYANLAVAYCALTDRCEAEGVDAAQLAVDLDRRLGLLDHLAIPLIVLGQIHQCHGDHASALASFEEALGLAEQVGEPQLLFPCYDGLATLNLDAGNQAMAEVYLAKAQEVCKRAGVEPDALMVLPFLC